MFDKNGDWLCSKCGQVSNRSEPCYDCDRKEREANPIPPPPPAPGWPTRDSSRKKFIKPMPETSYVVIDFGDWDFGLSRWLLKQLLCFIDWLNNLAGAEKQKNKSKDGASQRLSLAELFDEEPAQPLRTRPRPPRPGQPPGNTSRTR